MGSEARAKRASELSAAQRPFADVEGTEAWLEAASIPIEGSGASLSSLYGLPKGYTPARLGVTGDVRFDPTAEQQTKQYLAGLSEAPGKPFAAGEAVKGWLDQASRPLTSNVTSEASSLYEKYSPSQAEMEGDQAFDGNAEEQTRQYLAGLPEASRRPFAAEYNVPGWREAASSPMVRDIYKH